MTKHDALIAQLCSEMQPVKRPAAPWLRAALWMLVALPCGFIASLAIHRHGSDWSNPGALWAGLAIFVSFCLGTVAIATAFTLSIAGRRLTHRHWRSLTALSVAWLMVNLIDVTFSSEPWGDFGDGIYCYTFMMLAGLPMMALMIAALRRTRSLHPGPSLAIAGLGIASMTQILLGFCHPVAGDVMDLIMHLAAAATLVAVCVLAGRRWIAL
ncbi:NrsF family protein [Janthinobacterium sp. Mn2066]|uniref:NrsF family protein n=1 Tax=Janthinobacterium sp. Mn2066 TaxID=3395264 RepID=UPI003BD07A27